MKIQVTLDSGITVEMDGNYTSMEFSIPGHLLRGDLRQEGATEITQRILVGLVEVAKQFEWLKEEQFSWADKKSPPPATKPACQSSATQQP